MEMNFDLNEPFKPFEQLLAVLPAASADCLPPPYRVINFDCFSGLTGKLITFLTSCLISNDVFIKDQENHVKVK